MTGRKFGHRSIKSTKDLLKLSSENMFSKYVRENLEEISS